MSSIIIYNESKQKWNLGASGDKNMAVISKNKCSIGAQVDKKTLKMLRAFINKSGQTRVNLLALPDFITGKSKSASRYDLRYSKKTMEPYLRDVDAKDSKSVIALITIKTNFKKIINVKLDKNVKILEYSLPQKLAEDKFIDLIVHIEDPSNQAGIEITTLDTKTLVIESKKITVDRVKVSIDEDNVKLPSEFKPYKFTKMRPYHLTELLLVDEGYEAAAQTWAKRNRRDMKHVFAILPKNLEAQDSCIQELINKGYRAVTYMDGYARENKKIKEKILNKLAESFRYVYTTRYRENKRNKSLTRFK